MLVGAALVLGVRRLGAVHCVLDPHGDAIRYGHHEAREAARVRTGRLGLAWGLISSSFNSRTFRSNEKTLLVTEDCYLLFDVLMKD